MIPWVDASLNFNSSSSSSPRWEIAVHLAVACGVYGDVFLCVLSFFPRGVLDEILNLIESVSEDFPSYSSSAGASYYFGL